MRAAGRGPLTAAIASPSLLSQRGRRRGRLTRRAGSGAWPGGATARSAAASRTRRSPTRCLPAATAPSTRPRQAAGAPRRRRVDGALHRAARRPRSRCVPRDRRRALRAWDRVGAAPAARRPQPPPEVDETSEGITTNNIHVRTGGALAALARLRRPTSVDRGGCAVLARRLPMTKSRSTTSTTATTTSRLFYDQVESPLGPFTVVADADGELVAAGWTDEATDGRMASRLHALANRSDVTFVRASNPGGLSAALAAYFAGALTAIERLPLGEAAGTPFQRSVWSALRSIRAGRAGRTASSRRRSAGRGGARGRPGQRRQPDLHRRPLPPRDRRERQARRLWRRHRAQALAAARTSTGRALRPPRRRARPPHCRASEQAQFSALTGPRGVG